MHRSSCNNSVCPRIALLNLLHNSRQYPTAHWTDITEHD